MLAIVLGIHSFLDPGIKVGIQYIAEGLADRGWQVDYISFPSSPFDVYGQQRRKRLRRVWLAHQDQEGIPIKRGLTEYAFRTLHPAHKLFLRSDWQMDWFPRLSPAWLKTRRYDLCIHDVTVNFLFLPKVQSDLLVLRLNDAPEGFAHSLHRKLIDRFRNKMASPAYDEIWAVSEPLAGYARKFDDINKIFVLPNGVEDRFHTIAASGTIRPKRAVFLGSVSQWVDMELLEQTALLLPDWQFHVYGPCDIPHLASAPNLLLYPPVRREAVPDLLSAYRVGLIPFRPTSSLVEYIERPLKFYEYIGAGLGVASTDIGALRAGMGELACYGNTPRDFARAVEMAARAGAERSAAFNRQFIADHSWDKIMELVCSRIAALKSSAAQRSQADVRL